MITFLKKTFNISGCEITINPERSVFHQGDEVKCGFTITSSEYEQTADEISISLEESWEETSGSGDNQSTVTIREDRVLSVVGTNLIIKPGDSHQYEFRAKLPQNCRLSDSSDSLGWCLVVKIDVPFAKDPKERLSIEVIPHKEFLAIEHSLETVLKFEKKKYSFFSIPTKHKKHYNNDYTSGVRFFPPEVLKSELDCLDLHCNQDGITTHCEIVFDMQEKSLFDYFKMVVRQDKVKREILFSRDELFDENWDPDTKGISKKIAEEIQQVLTESGR